jgi:hypothetical protein
MKSPCRRHVNPSMPRPCPHSVVRAPRSASRRKCLGNLPRQPQLAARCCRTKTLRVVKVLYAGFEKVPQCAFDRLEAHCPFAELA